MLLQPFRIESRRGHCCYQLFGTDGPLSLFCFRKSAKRTQLFACVYRGDSPRGVSVATDRPIQRMVSVDALAFIPLRPYGTQSPLPYVFMSTTTGQGDRAGYQLPSFFELHTDVSDRNQDNGHSRPEGIKPGTGTTRFLICKSLPVRPEGLVPAASPKR